MLIPFVYFNNLAAYNCCPGKSHHNLYFPGWNVTLHFRLCFRFRWLSECVRKKRGCTDKLPYLSHTILRKTLRQCFPFSCRAPKLVAVLAVHTRRLWTSKYVAVHLNLALDALSRWMPCRCSCPIFMGMWKLLVAAIFVATHGRIAVCQSMGASRNCEGAI